MSLDLVMSEADSASAQIFCKTTDLKIRHVHQFEIKMVHYCHFTDTEKIAC